MLPGFKMIDSHPIVSNKFRDPLLVEKTTTLRLHAIVTKDEVLNMPQCAFGPNDVVCNFLFVVHKQ